MKLSKKKTCNRCAACPSDFSCGLGYRIEPAKEMYGAIVEWRPKEPCYKPTTISDFLIAKELAAYQLED